MFHSYTHCSTTTGSTTLTLSQIPSHHHYDESTPTKNLICGGNRLDIYGYSGIYATGPEGIQWGKGVWPEGGSGSHSHSISRSSTTTGSTGSGTSVDILNPYYVVYTWTRTV